MRISKYMALVSAAEYGSFTKAADLCQDPFFDAAKGRRFGGYEYFFKKRTFAEGALYHMGRLCDNVDGGERIGDKYFTGADLKKNTV